MELTFGDLDMGMKEGSSSSSTTCWALMFIITIDQWHAITPARKMMMLIGANPNRKRRRRRRKIIITINASAVNLFFSRSCQVGSGARWRSGSSADAPSAPWWCVTTAGSNPAVTPSPDYESSSSTVGLEEPSWMTAVLR